MLTINRLLCRNNLNSGSRINRTLSLISEKRGESKLVARAWFRYNKRLIRVHDYYWVILQELSKFGFPAVEKKKKSALVSRERFILRSVRFY